MNKLILQNSITLILILCAILMSAQADTITLGFGNFDRGGSISSSDPSSDPENVLESDGFLPNRNAASRFLTQAALGYGQDEINDVVTMGVEDWIEDQFNKPIKYKLIDKVDSMYILAKNATGEPDLFPSGTYWNNAWYDYHMNSDDYLRQRVAFALGEILVLSDNSDAGNGLSMSSYYDILLDNAFGYFDTLLHDVTYNSAMGIFLTYVNNPKSDTSRNRFPDENYAREVMQLFTIGLYELNNDGTRKVDGNGDYIPTYDNETIAEFSKIFTGLSYGNNPTFWDWAKYDRLNYELPMKMFNDYHEPGTKTLLNGFIVPDRNPVDGNADVKDALNNLFTHPNVGPFIATRLIQRLVTSNPSTEYVDHVASVFNSDENGKRGNMKAVIKAILLYDSARNCDECDDDETFGKLSEPFQRYMQLNKILDITTTSGNYRNAMYGIDIEFGQSPLSAPSVFNWFLPDYTPLGPIDKAGLYAPEFQITNSQSILTYMNALQDILIYDNIAEEWSLYNGEPEADRFADQAQLDYSRYVNYADDDKIHILLDELNMVLAAGRISDNILEDIVEFVLEFELEIGGDYEYEEREDRVKAAILLIMSSPDYLVKK